MMFVIEKKMFNCWGWITERERDRHKETERYCLASHFNGSLLFTELGHLVPRYKQFRLLRQTHRDLCGSAFWK